MGDWEKGRSWERKEISGKTKLDDGKAMGGKYEEGKEGREGWKK